MDFLIDRHAYFSLSGTNSLLPEDPFSGEWTRQALKAVVARGVGHITQVNSSRVPCDYRLMFYFRATCCGMPCATGRLIISQRCCRMRGEHYEHCPLFEAIGSSLRSMAVVEIEERFLERLQQCHSSASCGLRTT